VNVKEFISSGIIESYVLGLCTDAERQEVESACEHYAEIAEARDLAESKMEELLVKDQQAPPGALKEKVFSQLQNATEAAESGEDYFEDAPAMRIGPWKWVAAACFLLLLGSLIWNFSLQKQNRELRLAGAVPDTSLQKELAETRSELNQVRSEYSMLKSPGLKMAALKGWTGNAVKASIFWDTTSKDVYLVINNLPEPASDKQYQLWALIKKQPVDLGVFNIEQQKLMVKMKNVQQAEAFAITLEPSGGSTQPTMDKMYAYGKL
jgi:anti-sigma-K factor RskA